MAGRFSSLRTGAAAVAPARVALRWRPEAGSSPSSMKPGSNFVRVALVGDAASRLYRAARFLRQLEHLPYRQTCQVALCGIPPLADIASKRQNRTSRKVTMPESPLIPLEEPLWIHR
jgi:hypothetical protein